MRTAAISHWVYANVPASRARLGGAVATHVRVDSPLFTHTLFPVYLAVLIWGSLLLREERLGALLPLRR